MDVCREGRLIGGRDLEAGAGEHCREGTLLGFQEGAGAWALCVEL